MVQAARWPPSSVSFDVWISDCIYIMCLFAQKQKGLVLKISKENTWQTPKPILRSVWKESFIRILPGNKACLTTQNQVQYKSWVIYEVIYLIYNILSSKNQHCYVFKPNVNFTSNFKPNIIKSPAEKHSPSTKQP